MTEYVEGPRLIDVIQESRGMDEATCRFYAAQMILFLETLHGAGAVYRDIKAENILVSHWDHYLRFIDFGYSSYLEEKSNCLRSYCGTLEYLCPEKIQGHAYDQSSDIWSLGILFFVMICDRFPYRFTYREGKGKDAITLIPLPPAPIEHPVVKEKAQSMISTLKHVSKDIPSLFQAFAREKKRPAISPDLVSLVSWMLRYKRQNRPTITQIKQHPWFKSINFDLLARKGVQPPPVTYHTTSERKPTGPDPWEKW